MFAHVIVAPSAVYLGAKLGPEVKDHAWNEVATKAAARSANIALKRQPAQLSQRECSLCVSTLWGYLSQFYPTPAWLPTLDLLNIHKLSNAQQSCVPATALGVWLFVNRLRTESIDFYWSGDSENKFLVLLGQKILMF